MVSARQGYERIEAGTQLDFRLQISSVAEGMFVALSIARILGFNTELSTMKFAVRWTVLKGRVLTSWAEPGRFFRSFGSAAQNEFEYAINVPLNVAKADIHEYVGPVIDNFFAIFGGAEISSSVVAEVVDATLNRR